MRKSHKSQGGLEQQHAAPRCKWLQGMDASSNQDRKVSLPRTFGHQQWLPLIKIEAAENLGINSSSSEPPIDSETDGGKTSSYWRAAGGVYTRGWFTF